MKQFRKFWDLVSATTSKTSCWEEYCRGKSRECSGEMRRITKDEIENFFLDMEGNTIPVGKTFLCDVFKVSKETVETFQRKLAADSDLGDRRGNYEK